jgi:hypothetical protein
MLLIDNDSLECWIAAEGIPKGVDIIEFSCVSGYSGYFTMSDYGVTYAHGNFVGTFGTDYKDSWYGDGSVLDPLKHYQQWTASVWNC